MPNISRQQYLFLHQDRSNCRTSSPSKRTARSNRHKHSIASRFIFIETMSPTEKLVISKWLPVGLGCHARRCPPDTSIDGSSKANIRIRRMSENCLNGTTHNIIRCDPTLRKHIGSLAICGWKCVTLFHGSSVVGWRGWGGSWS